MKATVLTICILLVVSAGAQDRYFTKTGTISFYSSTALEDIEAVNRTATAVLNNASGALQFSVLMKSFEFKKALMQEHFNANYVESDRYPKAEFKGAVVNNISINYKQAGEYPAMVKGKLTIHGVARDVEAKGNITVSGNAVKLESVFFVKVSDYNIKIPSVVKDKISNRIEVKVNCTLQPLQ